MTCALQSGGQRPVVSVLIKALNEERRIGSCLEAAVREAESVGGEVILVDSISSDRTVRIAQHYPIRIVQFKSGRDRGCAAAVQLGYQVCLGDFVYVLDADMVMQPGFLKLALARLQGDPGLAGVAGKLTDSALRTATDERRFREAQNLVTETEVASLGGGGLYRRAAIEELGYLAHRYLPANEEAELGLRLRAGGWRLLKLPVVAVVHEGHAESNWQMMARLWRGGRFRSSGMLVRSALATPWFWPSVQLQRHSLYAPILHSVFLAVSLGLSAWAGLPFVVPWFCAWMMIWLGLAMRPAGFVGGFWTILAWHLFALGFVLGLAKRIGSPLEDIDFVSLQDGRFSP